MAATNDGETSCDTRQKSEGINAKTFFQININCPFPASEYTVRPNICTFKWTVSINSPASMLIRFFSGKINNKCAPLFCQPMKDCVYSHLSLVFSAAHQKVSCESGRRWAPFIPPLRDLGIDRVCHFEGCLNCKEMHLDEKGATEARRGIMSTCTGVSSFWCMWHINKVWHRCIWQTIAAGVIFIFTGRNIQSDSQ